MPFGQHACVCDECNKLFITGDYIKNICPDCEIKKIMTEKKEGNVLHIDINGGFNINTKTDNKSKITIIHPQIRYY